jgi:hypothetical protein
MILISEYEGNRVIAATVDLAGLIIDQLRRPLPTGARCCSVWFEWHELGQPRRIMDEDVADGQLIDLCQVDLASLVAKAGEPGMKTALDRVFSSTSAGSFGFNSSLSESEGW